MPRFAYLFLALILALPTQAAAKDDMHWLQGYKGQSADDVLADKRFKDFTGDHVPDFDLDLGFGPHGIKTGLKSAIMEVLGGPPDPVTSPDDHTIVVSACRENSCREKGLMWIDANEAQSVLAIVHYVYAGKYSDKPQMFIASGDFSCGLYPLAAVDQIKFWLKQNEITPATVRCLDGKKVSETIL